MIPVLKNREYEMQIESVAGEGNGIGHIDGFAVFVPDTVDGDVVRVLIVKVAKNYAFGKVTEVLRPSELRVEPVCPNSGKCGGCQLMHIDYKHQLLIKENIIKDAIKRIGGICDFEFEKVYGMDKPYNYRNKLIFPFGINKENEAVCGFYAKRSHRVVPLGRCFLGDELHQNVLRCVMEHIGKYNISVYDEEKHTGVLRRVFIRQGFHTGQAMVVLSANAHSLKGLKELADRLMAEDKRIVSVILNVNTKKTNLVLGDENITVSGVDEIEDYLCGLKYKISPNSFFQINPSQTEVLYQKAIEYADIKPNETVMDLYCGIGTISLLAAKSAKKVLGVEIVPQAIENAKSNAKDNNVKNVEFICSAAEDIVPKLILEGNCPDVVILDPPRKGSDEKTLEAIAQAKPDKIVYVSCNPATLARDVKFLAGFGYKLKKVAGVDMFPHTMHIECTVLLCREK